MVVWVAMSAGWLVGFTDGDSALFIRDFRDSFFPQVTYLLSRQRSAAAAVAVLLMDAAADAAQTFYTVSRHVLLVSPRTSG
jgi:hypothetical protein